MACGGGSSSSDSAASSSTQVSALAINTADVVAVGTADTSGGALRLADKEGSAETVAVGLTAEGRIVNNMLSVDNNGFVIHKAISAGSSMLVYATLPAIGNTQDDALLPNGNLLMADCHGQIRIRDGEASCLISDRKAIKASDVANALDYIFRDSATESIKTDKMGNLFVNVFSTSLVKVNDQGVASTLVASETAEADPLTLMDITDDGSVVVLVKNLIRVYTKEGTAKTISTGYAKTKGNFIHTMDGIFTSKGVQLDITGLTSTMFTDMGIAEGKIYGLDYDRIITIDTESKTAETTQLTAKSIYASVFVGSTLYYATTTEGVSKVELGSSGLRLTAPVETKVEGLDDVSIFSMTKVGDKVIFSGQNDSTLGYVTGVISGDIATRNTSDVKISAIQAL
jgi:hypothetical protein